MFRYADKAHWSTHQYLEKLSIILLAIIYFGNWWIARMRTQSHRQQEPINCENILDAKVIVARIWLTGGFVLPRI